MIHYAVQPVYMPPEANYDYHIVDYMGYEVVACHTEEGFILDRIFSSNPQDFLIDSLQPGTLLQNSLINKIIQ
ncbi:MAG: YlzJ-like family protein [Niameybacter sp.]|uniref:YlzJ-like family protein n=1 Tax=Niameybacter sp. TaxID=2033640 RepID=UPI002FCAD520